MQQSNHTLESLFIPNHRRGTGVPIPIHSILCMNRNGNKHAVIREKILRNHNLDQVNFVPASLPIVFAWLGDANIDHTLGLSQLFLILRAVPHMVRKEDDETRGVKSKELNDE
jgi:hypothetical protein